MTVHKKVPRAFLFGSFASGRDHPGSDIDVAIVSPFFTKGAYRDHVALMRLKAQANMDIEPHPFHPSAFVEEDPLVWEIKHKGIRIR